MGRKLRDKNCSSWILQRSYNGSLFATALERDNRARIPQNEYEDRTRGAKRNNSEEGDKVPWKQTRENKLSPNYEAYSQRRKCCHLARYKWNSKMRNMKKFVDLQTVNRGQIDAQPHLPEQPVQPEQDHPAESQPYLANSRYIGSSIYHLAFSCFAPFACQASARKITYAHSLNYSEENKRLRAFFISHFELVNSIFID